MQIVSQHNRRWRIPGLGSASAPIVLGMSAYHTRDELLMRLVTLAQDSPDWHRWRSKGIGASESSSILGMNPWQSREQTFALKTGLVEPEGDNVHTRRGKRLEPEAREIYEDLMGWKMPPACVIHDDYDFIRASLDGLRSDHKLIAEIKAPSQRWHEHTIERGMPDWYAAQVQHQLMIVGASMAHFVSYCPAHRARPLVIQAVKSDPEFQAVLLSELVAFWAEVKAAS